MEIAIDNRFRLVTDKTGWELQQYRPATKGPNAGKPGWYSEGHFDTLQWALRGAAQLMMHEGRGKATLEQLAQRIEVVEARVVEALDRYHAPVPPGQSYVRNLRPLERVGPWAGSNGDEVPRPSVRRHR